MSITIRLANVAILSASFHEDEWVPYDFKIEQIISL